VSDPGRSNAFYPRRVGRAVRLGAFTVVDAYSDRPSGGADRALEVVGLAEEVEAAGLSSLWVAEHHFQGGGACPSPPVLLAACGMRTRRIRLGSLVSVLPFHRPVDVAEEYALVDRLLGGRLNLGVGSGYLAAEFAGFGLDPADKRARFDAGLETVLAAFAGRPIRAGGDASPPVALNVVPVQQPHPPIWVAVQRREAIPFVARKGLSVALIPYATVDTLEQLAAVIDDYRRALPPGSHGEVAAAVHVYAGPDAEPGREAFRRYVRSRLQSGSTFLERKTHDRPEHASPEAIEGSGLALFGTGAEVAERMDAFRRIGVDELLGIFDFGGLPSEEVARSVRAMGEAWDRLPARGSASLPPRGPPS
jgi:alkanesulfonate monooxygenase SsuD/methylene tetrahydromethanopterin reductase-like flavin-dependent oxidoreductase (luciferase family)